MKRLIGALALLTVLNFLIVGASLPAAPAPLLKPGHTPIPEKPAPEAARTAAPCPVSPFAEDRPSDPDSPIGRGNWYGNDPLWAAGGPWVAGSDGVKVMWYRAVPGKLTISGWRLDAPSAELVAHVPDGYGDQGLQVSGLYFPTGGCWEITGEIGGRSTRFVLQIEAGDAPNASFPVVAQASNGPQHAFAFEDVGRRHLYVVLPDENNPLDVSVSVLDRKTMAEVARRPWPAFCLHLLVIAENGDWICAYSDGQDGRLVRLLNVDFDHTGAPHSLGYVQGRVTGGVMNRSGGRLYAVTEGAQLAVVDVPQQRILYYKRLGAPPETTGLSGQILLSPDGRRLYLGFEQGGEDSGTAQIVRAYDTARWNSIGDLDLVPTPAWRLSLNSTGDRLYGISERGEIDVYDTTTLQRVATNP